MLIGVKSQDNSRMNNKCGHQRILGDNIPYDII